MDRLHSTLVSVALLGSACTCSPGQASIGSVEAASATIAGTLSLTGGTALVGANAVITARDRTADLKLSRGGEILVCSTSALHVARGAGAAQPAPLLLALDRGAVEIHMAATTADAILTPDLRFTIASIASQSGAGLLDLRIRVAANGDTCVENRGKASPTLDVAEQFSNGLYQIHPNQHLLFEHGSVREVVDGETSPCGCPPPPVLSAADSGISTDVTRAARPGARVADDPDEVRPHAANEVQHPFPAAESQGLTLSGKPASVPQSPPHETHAQVAATLSYGPDGKGFDGSQPTGSSASASDFPSPASAGNVPASAGSSSTPVSGSSSSAARTGGELLPASPPVPSVPAHSPARSPAAAPSPPAPASVRGPDSVNDRLSDHEVAQAPLPPAAPAPRTIAHRVGHFFRHLFGGR